MGDKDILLSVKGLHKSFGNNHVLNDISFDVGPGETHVLLGENGAGKSTLIKILTGAYKKDKGDLYWMGELVDIASPNDAMDLGIATVYQELNVFPELTVYENIFIGREVKKKFPLLDRDEMRNTAKKYMKQLGQNPDIVDMKLGDLGVGRQQLVEIAKALTVNARLIVMDEPTSSLSSTEVEQLYETVFKLKERGIAIIFISHRLDEIKMLGDKVTILRDGKVVDSLVVEDTSADRMIELMVGRSLDEKFPKQKFERGEVGLSVKNLRLKGSEHAINFEAYQGEILGISGLVGAGRTEILRGIFGADQIDEGEITIFGEKVKIRSPRDAIKHGMAFITEDRKEEGLILDQTVYMNVGSANLKKFSNGILLNINKIKNEAKRFVTELKVRPNNIELDAGLLSGGNQQKVVIAKWLNTNAKIYLFDEPTRGIDVGAKTEVYRLINSLVEQGCIAIIVSSELPEILGMCDRMLVLNEGQITGEFTREEASQEKIMKAAVGG